MGKRLNETDISMVQDGAVHRVEGCFLLFILSASYTSFAVVHVQVVEEEQPEKETETAEQIDNDDDDDNGKAEEKEDEEGDAPADVDQKDVFGMLVPPVSPSVCLSEIAAARYCPEFVGAKVTVPGVHRGA